MFDSIIAAREPLQFPGVNLRMNSLRIAARLGARSQNHALCLAFGSTGKVLDICYNFVLFYA
jgi:hypothetical protein